MPSPANAELMALKQFQSGGHQLTAECLQLHISSFGIIGDPIWKRCMLTGGTNTTSIIRCLRPVLIIARVRDLD